MVLFRHNLPQPTQAQRMRGEFPETLCIEQGVVLSCRFKCRVEGATCSSCARMAVVSQSSVKLGKTRVFLVGTINFITSTAEVATSKFVLFLYFIIFKDFPKALGLSRGSPARRMTTLCRESS